ncbi:hypothetical protein V8E36_002614 [Tilletia maclaganii]
MAAFEVNIECTPSTTGLVSSKSFPAWSRNSKMASSPTLSSCSGSSSGPESSLPSYSHHRAHSTTFSFPLPPSAPTSTDVKIPLGDKTQRAQVTSLQLKGQARSPPPYDEETSPVKVDTELENIARLHRSLSLLQLPQSEFEEEELDDFDQVSLSRCGNDGHARSRSHSIIEPLPRLELSLQVDEDTDGRLNFDAHDLDHLSSIIEGLPTQLTQVNAQGQRDTVEPLQERQQGGANCTAPANQSPILSGLLSETAKDTVWEVDIAFETKEGDDKHMQDGHHAGDTAILRLELSPVEVAQLFHIPIAVASPPQLHFDLDRSAGEITVDDLYDGIEIATISPETIGNSSDPLVKADTTRVQANDELAVQHQGTVFSSPALATPDLDMVNTPALMDSWPTPIMDSIIGSENAGTTTAIDSIARLLESAKPVGVTITASALGRTRSERGVLHSPLSPIPNVLSPEVDEELLNGAATSLLIRRSAPAPTSPPATPALSILHRPRAKPRREATSFFGTTKRDKERKLMLERLTSRSSTLEGSPVDLLSVSGSTGSMDSDRSRADSDCRPEVPARKSSHGCVRETASSATERTEAAPPPLPMVVSGSTSADSCTYRPIEDEHEHCNDSSPAAYWVETREMLSPSLGQADGSGGAGAGAGSALLEELRRQKRHSTAVAMMMVGGAAAAASTAAPSPSTPATLQKTRAVSKGGVSSSAVLGAPANGRALEAETTISPTRSGFGGQIFKAFRRSPRVPAPVEKVVVVGSNAGAGTNGEPLRPILVKNPSTLTVGLPSAGVIAPGSIPMAASASKQSSKTTFSTATTIAATPTRSSPPHVQQPQPSPRKMVASCSAPSTAAPTVLTGQALHEVKQACQQKVALIRAAAMVAAAEEQRAAATAAYRAAEAALLASRRQSQPAAPQQQILHHHPGGEERRSKGRKNSASVSGQQLVAQILFDAEAPERRHNVPSIRAISSSGGRASKEERRASPPISPTSVARGSSSSQISSNPSETVLLHF